MNPVVEYWKEKLLAFTNTYVYLENLIAVSLGFLSLLLTLLYIRSRFPTTVNCWFCNNNSKVPGEKKNSWYCEHCQQYNGFAEDGGYNKIIPEQHFESLNPQFTERSIDSPIGSSNGLCKSCNVNQELKRAQLASFEPLDPNNYDWEVEAFSELLEKSNKLCSFCERVVSNTLESQIRNLNLSQLITTASHKLATSSVRFLNDLSNPVDVNILLSSSKNSLCISCLLLTLLLFEVCDKSSLKTALNGSLGGFLNTTVAVPHLMTYSHAASTYLLDHLSEFNLFPVVMCSIVQIVKRHEYRILVDYIMQFSWIVLLGFEVSHIFSKSQLDIRSVQIMILALIFTLSLWKFTYFKFFFSKSNKSSPKSKADTLIKDATFPETAENHFSGPLNNAARETPKLASRNNNKSKPAFNRSHDSDLGIGALNLGPKQTAPPNMYAKNVFSVSHDSFPSKRKPLILPSRLNFNLKNELSEINIPFSRPSSQSSGYETMNRSQNDSQNGSLMGDEEYDLPLKASSPFQVSNYGMVPPFRSPAPSPYELYSYYHFTAKFQASYGGPTNHNVSTCSSCAGPVVPLNSNKWFLVVFFMFFLIVLQESFILYSLLNR